MAVGGLAFINEICEAEYILHATLHQAQHTKETHKYLLFEKLRPLATIAHRGHTQTKYLRKTQAINSQVLIGTHGINTVRGQLKTSDHTGMTTEPCRNNFTALHSKLVFNSYTV